MLILAILALQLQLFSFQIRLVTAQSQSPSSTTSFSISQTAPDTSIPVSPNLIGLSLEGDRWQEWVALPPSFSSPNTFTHNTLMNLQGKTGVPVDIRVGANSEDRTLFDKNLAIEDSSFPPPTAKLPYPEASNITVGPGYYALSHFLPEGTRMTWGINFGSADLNTSVNEAKAIFAAFEGEGTGRVKLDMIELGNEPDLYAGSIMHRNSSWNIASYVSQWSDFMKAILLASQSHSTRETSVLGLSFGHSDHGAGNFSPQQAFADGLLDTFAGGHIKVISQHEYSGGCCTALLSDLMSKDLIRSNLTTFVPDISAVHEKGLHYIFGEGNSYFNHGVPDVSDAAGAAVWITDYILFGATLGIEKMFFHEGIGFKYNLIQPVSLNRSTEDATPLDPPVAPHVQAPYYGAIVVDEFLGSVDGRKVVELETDNDSISGYAIYGGAREELQRAMFINHDVYLTSSSSPRSSVSITISLSSSTTRARVRAKRLLMPFSDDKTGLTWGGQNYDTPSGLVDGGERFEWVDFEGAKGEVDLNASEVVMLFFEGRHNN